MTNAKTYFEQIPVALAKRIAQQDGSVSHTRPVSCAICGRPVELERCKIDEYGGAVHDACYVAKVSKVR